LAWVTPKAAGRRKLFPPPGGRGPPATGPPPSGPPPPSHHPPLAPGDPSRDARPRRNCRSSIPTIPRVSATAGAQSCKPDPKTPFPTGPADPLSFFFPRGPPFQAFPLGAPATPAVPPRSCVEATPHPTAPPGIRTTSHSSAVLALVPLGNPPQLRPLGRDHRPAEKPKGMQVAPHSEGVFPPTPEPRPGPAPALPRQRAPYAVHMAPTLGKVGSHPRAKTLCLGN